MVGRVKYNWAPQSGIVALAPLVGVKTLPRLVTLTPMVGRVKHNWAPQSGIVALTPLVRVKTCRGSTRVWMP